jgi:ribosome-associated protein
MDDEPLEITNELIIPAGDLIWRFGPSGGPGGQHANRAHSRAELGFDLVGSPAVPEPLRARMVEALGSRLVNGEVWVSVDASRSQWRNRQLARQRLRELLVDASKPPPPPRKKTKPSRAARRRRVEEKRYRGEVKRLRKRPSVE